MDFKETLHLPKSNFEMRGNLSKKEPGIQATWDEIDLYHLMKEAHKDKTPFVLHDGPPYANGNIHLGHALNKIAKDIMVRSKFMAGFDVFYKPGWDTHGLPIETAIQKSGVNRKEMSIADFRKLCRAYALEQVAIQKADFKSLGVVGEYKNPYITLTNDYVSKQIRVFAQMAEKGMVYRGLRPVIWSPSSETALAEAEVEYKDRRDPEIYVKFMVQDGKGVLSEDDAFIIWTTTPWTIPANLAIALNAEMDYELIQTDKGRFIVAQALRERVVETLELSFERVLRTFKGSELEGITTKHPLFDRLSPILLGDHVTDESGTGAVHTAPDHGAEDFEVAKAYGIHPMGSVDARGHLTEATGPFAGMFFEKANKEITQALESVGALMKLSFFTHSYAHDWRTKEPIIYRATTQWFVSIDPVRERILEEIKNVTWRPAWGERRMHNMIADRGDWTISRQRAWGVPIPIFYTEKDTPVMDVAVFNHVADLFLEHGPDIWYEWDAKALLPEGYDHQDAPNGVFTKEKDIMDVWFDSGSSHTAGLDPQETPLPVDVYLEGTDQYRGWFNSSLIISVAIHGIAPYKNVVTNGFLMDGKEKMSKSRGDSMQPRKVTETLGADILHLWIGSIDYQSDINVPEDALKQVSETYRKIRNTFRFMHGNLDGFDFDTQSVAVAEMNALNRYVLQEAMLVNDLAQKAYADFDYQKVTSLVSNSMTNLMSSYYLDYTKDILYIEAKESHLRREIQTVLHIVLDMYMKLLAPVLPHTMEELYGFVGGTEPSVHLESFVGVEYGFFSETEAAQFKALFELREAVFKALEEKRADKVIGKSLEAHVTLHVDATLKQSLETLLGDHLAQWFIVSSVSFTNDTLPEVLGFEVDVTKQDGVVCQRCWNVVDHVNDHGVCARCNSVLNHD